MNRIPDTKQRMTKCGVERASQILDKSPMAVYQDVARRKIPFRRLGRHVYFFEEELFEMLDGAPGVRLEDLPDCE